MTATRSNKRPAKAKRAAAIPGICADAETLGVNRDHLRLVLTGKRISARLSRRYSKLKASPQPSTPSPAHS